MARFPCMSPDVCKVTYHLDPSSCIGSNTGITAASGTVLVVSHEFSVSSIKKLSDGAESSKTRNFIKNEANIGDQFTMTFRSKDEEDAEMAYDTLDEIRNELRIIRAGEPFTVRNDVFTHRYDSDDPLKIHISQNVNARTVGEDYDDPPLAEFVREIDGLGLIDEQGISVTSHIKTLSGKDRELAATATESGTWVSKDRQGEFYDTGTMNMPNAYKWAMTVKDRDEVVVRIDNQTLPSKFLVYVTSKNDGHEEVSFDEDQFDQMIRDMQYAPSREDQEFMRSSLLEIAKIKMNLS